MRVNEYESDGRTRACSIGRTSRELSWEGHTNGDQNAESQGADPECSRTRPSVSDKYEINDLSKHSHDAIDSTDQQRCPASKADGAIEDILIVLDDGWSAELSHHQDKAGRSCAAEIVAGEKFAGCIDKVRAAGSPFELNLVADLNEFFL